MTIVGETQVISLQARGFLPRVSIGRSAHALLEHTIRVQHCTYITSIAAEYACPLLLMLEVGILYKNIYKYTYTYYICLYKSIYIYISILTVYVSVRLCTRTHNIITIKPLV